jgi:hypothetical protein
MDPSQNMSIMFTSIGEPNAIKKSGFPHNFFSPYKTYTIRTPVGKNNVTWDVYKNKSKLFKKPF